VQARVDPMRVPFNAWRWDYQQAARTDAAPRTSPSQGFRLNFDAEGLVWANP